MNRHLHYGPSPHIFSHTSHILCHLSRLMQVESEIQTVGLHHVCKPLLWPSCNCCRSRHNRILQTWGVWCRSCVERGRYSDLSAVFGSRYPSFNQSCFVCLHFSLCLLGLNPQFSWIHSVWFLRFFAVLTYTKCEPSMTFHCLSTWSNKTYIDGRTDGRSAMLNTAASVLIENVAMFTHVMSFRGVIRAN